MTAPTDQDRCTSTPQLRRWSRRGYREVGGLLLIGSWATAIWLSPEVPLNQLHYPFIVLAVCGFICFRLIGAPVLIMRSADLKATGVLQTWTIPYEEIDRLDDSNGLTLHLRGGEEVFVTAMPMSLFQAIIRDPRLARLTSLLQERVQASAGRTPARPRTRSTVAPLLKQAATVAGVFATTYLTVVAIKLH